MRSSSTLARIQMLFPCHLSHAQHLSLPCVAPRLHLLDAACWCLQETGELQRAQHAALQGLHELTQAVAHPSADFVEQAAHCGRWEGSSALSAGLSQQHGLVLMWTLNRVQPAGMLWLYSVQAAHISCIGLETLPVSLQEGLPREGRCLPSN